MSTVRFNLLIPTLLLTALGVGVAPACASSSSSPGGGSGDGSVSSGGIANYGTGGTSGSTGGGGGTTSGGGSSNGYTFHGTVTPAPDATVSGAVISTFLSCSTGGQITDGGVGCQYAHCVPDSLANSVASSSVGLLGKCSDGTSYCIPDDFIATLGKFELKKCASVSGFEGRCISTCIPQVAQLSYALPQDVCADGELCAPCYYPWPADPGTDGQTGACTAGEGDAPQGPAQRFASCGNSLGLCVPKTLVPTKYLTLLPKDTCTGADELCAPIEKVKDLNYKFPSCAPQAAPLPPDPTQPGVCVPKYIVDYYATRDGGNALASLLTQSDCTNSGDICAPCNDPTTGQPTGACL